MGEKDNPRCATDARPITLLGRLVRLFTKFAAFFTICGGVSHSFFGAPEGCALSVCATVAAGYLYHYWMEDRCSSFSVC